MWGVTGTEFTPAARCAAVLTLSTVSDMKKIFGLKPGENDGNFERVKGFLKMFEDVKKGMREKRHRGEG